MRASRRQRAVAGAAVLAVLAAGMARAAGEPTLPPAAFAAFNAEVDSAAAGGESWPCSPLLITRRLLGRDPDALVASRDLFCRDDGGVAVVTVRGSLLPGSDTDVWVNLRFAQLADATWRLVAVGAAEVPGAPAGRFVRESDVPFRKDEGGRVRYAADLGGTDVTLVNPHFFPTCARPDSGSALALRCLSPYSIRIAEFVVLSPVDLALRIAGPDGADLGTALFPGVAPGPYRVRIDGPGLRPGTYVIRFLDAEGDLGTQPLFYPPVR